MGEHGMSRAVWQLGQAIRECGIALERAGARLNGDISFAEPLSKHREVLGLTGHKPIIQEGCFIAPTAGVSGEVTVGAGSSIWYGAFVKGDRSKVSIGSNTTIQEGAVIQGGKGPVTIGSNATVGQGAVIGAATIGVAPKTTVPAGSLFGGNPAVFLRQLSSEEVAAMSKTVDSAKAMAPSHAAECNKTFAEIELEKKDYVWKLPKVNKDPLGLLSEQRAVYW